MVYVLRTLTYIRIETAFDQNPAKYVRVYVLGINHAWVKDKEMRPMRGVKCIRTRVYKRNTGNLWSLFACVLIICHAITRGEWYSYIEKITRHYCCRKMAYWCVSLRGHSPKKKKKKSPHTQIFCYLSLYKHIAVLGNKWKLLVSHYIHTYTFCFWAEHHIEYIVLC